MVMLAAIAATALTFPNPSLHLTPLSVHRSEAPSSVILPNDRAQDLLEGNALGFIDRIQDMEEHSLLTGHLPTTPWSGYSWSIYKGLLGNRYADARFPNASDWMRNFEYISSNPLSSIYASNDPAAIDRLSPSEKYDLLMGDLEGSLTKMMWQEGERYYRRNPRVSPWMGICHGRAAAATRYQAPHHAVIALAADGRTPIKFYVSDLKALASLLWARAMPQAHFIGQRCNEDRPEHPSRESTSDQCLNTNPGTWHLAIVNQVGRLRRGLIMDASVGPEVWNEPIASYQYSYFNPNTLEPAIRWQRALIDREYAPRDRLRNFRSANSRYLLGIAMDVTYSKSSAPDHSLVTDQPVLQAAHYVYDLELDSEFRIVGGEWYSDIHPDFLWTIPPEITPDTRGDHQLGAEQWDGRSAVPQRWLPASRESASRGQPLAKIINTLMSLSLR